MTLSTIDERFLTTACDWIRRQGEALILLQWSRAAGTKDFEIFCTPEAFRELVGTLPPSTAVVVWRQNQLPIRGVASDELIHQAKALIPDGAEYLIQCLDPVAEARYRWYRHRAGETHAELTADLQELSGERVAVGLWPDWPYNKNTEDVIEAVVPGEDGIVRWGTY